MPDFLALGECMVEIGPVENGKCRRGFAGDTFNTAWYARRLLPESWTVGYGSCIGSDAISEEMAAYMESHGIDTSAMRRLADRTVGLYMISLQDILSPDRLAGLLDGPNMFLGHCVLVRHSVWPSGGALFV